MMPLRYTLFSGSGYTNHIGKTLTLSREPSRYIIMETTIYIGSISSSTRVQMILPVVCSGTYFPFYRGSTAGYVRIENQSNDGKSFQVIESSASSLYVDRVVGIK